MKLSSLINFLRDKKYNFKLLNATSRDVSISGISEDSRICKINNLFVAIRGFRYDSHKDVEIIKRIASVVVVDNKYQINDNEYIYIQAENTRQALSLIASWWYGNPSSKLKLIGVTGTKGKTTTSSIVYQILRQNGFKAGLISTIGAKVGNITTKIGLHVTNPEPMLLHRLLKDMVKEHAKYVVLEVSSHGIDQGRIFGLKFEIAVLTNIAPEHLDYHKNLTDYKNTKFKLFQHSKKMIGNADDKSIKDLIQLNKPKYSYSTKSKSDYKIEEVDTGKYVNFILNYKNQKLIGTTSLHGKFNLLNIAAAIAVCHTLGLPINKIIDSIRNVKPIIGRLEKVPNKLGIQIYIDFAHTPESMEAVLQYFKTLHANKLITVFGCAGERDKNKRPRMGKISSKFSDLTVLTSEDPRSEKASEIIEQIRYGIKNAKQLKFVSSIGRHTFDTHKKYYSIVHDRSKAIEFAVKAAQSGDIVAILGKGHEKSMNYDGIEQPWSDKLAVNSILKKVSGSRIIK
ncbi:MAG TPA: UDP-N-acetylmuramoyl-L-alanyl-D-glutamate--2,6-diaminopimelate ligase [Patescibacteria group bacterium]|nr:UDP-N-acetylmuramoyl-L-alanyl-D-glutamate--2,6-diaminopimelate ligase [Patescibacteria group bacterium]